MWIPAVKMGNFTHLPLTAPCSVDAAVGETVSRDGFVFTDLLPGKADNYVG